MQVLRGRREIAFGQIIASSYVASLSLHLNYWSFYSFSGIVEPVENTSLPDDPLSVSNLDTIKTEGEQTLPTDAEPSEFSQVDIKEICEKVIMSWASLKVI